MLTVQGLRFAYPDGGDVISDVSFTLAPAEHLALVGENGSGKTTLARLACGLLKPSGGTVEVDGLDTTDSAKGWEIRRKVGIVFQDPDDQIVETTVEREIGFGLRNLGLEVSEVDRRVNRALDTFGIEPLRRRSCNLLSAGEKQIVTVASVFAMRPDYIILDESTSLLDSRSRRDLICALERLLEETGAGLAFISMKLEDVWICDRVVFLEGGTIGFEGSKEAFVSYIKERRLPLYGTSLFVSELMSASADIARKVSLCRDLSAACLAETLMRPGLGPKGEHLCQ